MVKARYGLPLAYAKLEGDSDADIITFYWWDAAAGAWVPVFRIKGSTAEVQKIGDILQNLRLKTGSPALELVGTESGARTFQVKEDAGAAKLTNVTDGVDELTVDPAANRVSFNRPVAAPQPLRKASATPTLGTGGTLGTAVDIAPASGFNGLVPLVVELAVSGIPSGETVSVRVTSAFSDGTTASVDKSYTADTVDYLTPADLLALMKDGVYITKLSVQAATSAADVTSESVTVTIGAIQW